VPVVQAYCYSKYLGHFELYFDERGELKTPVDGVGVKNASPILLDKTIQEDPQVSISSMFYEQLLRTQIPKAQKKTVKSSSFLHFWDLHA